MSHILSHNRFFYVRISLMKKILFIIILFNKLFAIDIDNSSSHIELLPNSSIHIDNSNSLIKLPK